jgi:hypothetical protein
MSVQAPQPRKRHPAPNEPIALDDEYGKRLGLLTHYRNSPSFVPGRTGSNRLAGLIRT